MPTHLNIADGNPKIIAARFNSSILRLGAVTMNSNANYAHRPNDGGTFDSICLHCFHTVTTATSEPNLYTVNRNTRVVQIRRCTPRQSRNFYVN